MCLMAPIMLYVHLKKIEITSIIHVKSDFRYSSIRPSILLCIHPSTHSFIHSFIHSSIYPFIIHISIPKNTVFHQFYPSILNNQCTVIFHQFYPSILNNQCTVIPSNSFLLNCSSIANTGTRDIFSDEFAGKDMNYHQWWW